MFRTKEVKRQLEQADVWKEQAERLRRTLAGIGERLTEAQIDVDQIGMSAAKMDRSLTKVVDGAKETKEEQEGAKETLRGLCDEIRDMDAQFALLGKAYDAQREFANEQPKALKDLMEQSKHYTGFSKTADDTALKSGETLQQIARSAEEMNEGLIRLGNLSLQSAIDAGRLGDAGLAYVQTAETIRQSAAELSGQMEAIRAQIDENLRLYQEQTQTLRKFISLVRDNNVTLGRIAAEAVAETKKSPFDWEKGRGKENCSALSEQIERAMQSSGARQTAVIGEMETVGRCYMEQQDSTAGIEQKIHAMKRMLSEIEQNDTE